MDANGGGEQPEKGVFGRKTGVGQENRRGRGRKLRNSRKMGRKVLRNGSKRPENYELGEFSRMGGENRPSGRSACPGWAREQPKTEIFSRKTGKGHENRRGRGYSSCFPEHFLFSCFGFMDERA